MANKKQTKKANRKANRVTRSADKAKRKIAKHADEGLGKLADSLQKNSERENAKLAAARIVAETTKS